MANNPFIRSEGGRFVVGVVKPVVEGVAQSVVGEVRVATKTLEFVFLQAGEKQANQTLCQ